MVAVEFHDNRFDLREPERHLAAFDFRLDAQRQRAHNDLFRRLIQVDFHGCAVVVHIPVCEARLFGLFDVALIARPYLVDGKF